MASETARDYVLGRLVLDYLKVFMWPMVAVVVVMIYQDDVRKILDEREVDIFGLRIGDKVEQIETQTRAEIDDIRALLEAQQASDNNGANPAIAEDIDAKLANLERNFSREIANVQTAQQNRRIEPSSPQATRRPAPASDSRSARAAAAERRGFEALIAHDVAAAIKAFDEARRIWPEYHNVAEIGNALRKRQDKLRDPDSAAWPQLYREIVTRYSWGLPEDLRGAIRQGAKKAY